MKGVNELLLNESTMMEVVQEWIVSRIPTEQVKVLSVTQVTDCGCKTFVIRVESPTE